MTQQPLPQLTHQASGLLVPRPGPRAAPWLAVTGGKGGVGKTLVAVNLACLAASQGFRTLLVDLDPGLGNVDVQLRLARRATLEDLVAGRCSPAEAIVPGPQSVQVLAGRSGARELAAAQAGYVAATLAAVARAARGFDLVVCDTGAGIGAAVIEPLRAARLALVVTTPDPSAVTDAYALCKIMLQEGMAPPGLVVNRARTREAALATATRLSAVSEKFLRTRLPWRGWLRADPGVEASVLEQKPFAAAGAGPALDDLRALCASALSELPGLRRSGLAQPGSAARVPAVRAGTAGEHAIVAHLPWSPNSTRS
jgi:flagellar biosynthesis protein FlhG